MRRLSTLFLVLFLALFAPGWAGPGRSLVFVQWTDAHYGHPEWDPSAWHEALREGVAVRPQAIVLTGDNVDNKCSLEEFRRRTDSFLTRYGPQIFAPIPDPGTYKPLQTIGRDSPPTGWCKKEPRTP